MTVHSIVKQLHLQIILPVSIMTLNGQEADRNRFVNDTHTSRQTLMSKGNTDKRVESFSSFPVATPLTVIKRAGLKMLVEVTENYWPTCWQRFAQLPGLM